MVSDLMRAFMTSPVSLLHSAVARPSQTVGKPLSKQNANHINPRNVGKVDGSAALWVMACHFFTIRVSPYQHLRLSVRLGRKPTQFGFGGAKTPIVCYTWRFRAGPERAPCGQTIRRTTASHGQALRN